MILSRPSLFFFFFNDTATTEIYTLSLHDALPISLNITACVTWGSWVMASLIASMPTSPSKIDRKSTRLNSSHLGISYAVFCLKKKKRHDRRRQNHARATVPITLDVWKHYR